MSPIKILLCMVFLLTVPTASLFAALTTPLQPTLTARQERHWERHQIEASIGRPLRFGERLLLGITRSKIKKAAVKPSYDGSAVFAGILGVLGLLIFLIGGFGAGGGAMGFGLLLCGLALILGIIGLQKIKESEGQLKGKGLANLGIVIGLVLGSVSIAFLLLFGGG